MSTHEVIIPIFSFTAIYVSYIVINMLPRKRDLHEVIIPAYFPVTAYQRIFTVIAKACKQTSQVSKKCRKLHLVFLWELSFVSYY